MVKRKTTRKRGGNPGKKGPYWLYGLHSVAAALANPERRCLKLLATQQGAAALAGSKIPANTQLSPQIAGREDLERALPPGAVHQGLALLVEPLPAPDLAAVLPAEGPAVVVALDQVSDPQNLGGILRSAAGFGALAVITQDRHAPGVTPSLAKAASGALEAVPLVQVNNLVRALEDLKKQGFWVVGLDAEAEEPLSVLDAGSRVVLLLGAEGAGLRRLSKETCDFLAAIPLQGPVASLNVGTAAAIGLYELLGRPAAG
ncbi:MAG: 23S rRNA (guanosine(2251)-2'-O)-methyltransferase RlmB [Kiloniellales bacterium]|nr:23S rRNA (guanosine(2251)-2'-O)-methyltransferase RlmB [Kiloniellales bacterium]